MLGNFYQCFGKFTLSVSCASLGAAEMYNLEVGDHAIAEQIVPCGMCRMCNKGSYNMCECHVTTVVHFVSLYWNA